MWLLLMMLRSWRGGYQGVASCKRNFRLQTSALLVTVNLYVRILEYKASAQGSGFTIECHIQSQSDRIF